MNITNFKPSKISIYVNNLFKQERPFKYLIGLFLIIIRVSHFFKIKKDGYAIYFFPTSLSLVYFVNNSARGSDEEILEFFLNPGDSYVDVGANIGTLALKACTIVGKQGSVIACEPHPRIYNYLSQNIKLNDFENIEAKNLGLGSKRGELFFSDQNDDDQNYIDIKGDIRVKVDTLDLLCNDFAKINLLKIDVEGFEKYVLEGGGDTLAKTQTIMIELAQRNFDRYGYSINDLIKQLSNSGFYLYQFKQGKIYPINSSALNDWNSIVNAIGSKHKL